MRVGRRKGGGPKSNALVNDFHTLAFTNVIIRYIKPYRE